MSPSKAITSKLDLSDPLNFVRFKSELTNNELLYFSLKHSNLLNTNEDEDEFNTWPQWQRKGIQTNKESKAVRINTFPIFNYKQTMNNQMFIILIMNELYIAIK
jgi:hypothetical protein